MYTCTGNIHLLMKCLMIEQATCDHRETGKTTMAHTNKHHVDSYKITNTQCIRCDNCELTLRLSAKNTLTVQSKRATASSRWSRLQLKARTSSDI